MLAQRTAEQIHHQASIPQPLPGATSRRRNIIYLFGLVKRMYELGCTGRIIDIFIFHARNWIDRSAIRRSKRAGAKTRINYLSDFQRIGTVRRLEGNRR
jgi:hypothetical protein